jgi:hypothetical protein
MRGLARLADSQFRIISGGETGVERAALDALIEPVRIRNPLATYGGWCPAGRKADDGTIPERYNLRELETGGREEAIERNLVEADGLLLVYFGGLKRFAEGALLRAIKWQKPYKLIEGSEIAPHRGAEIVRTWEWDHNIERLYVTGPSAREYSRGYDYALELINEVIGLPEG